MSSKLPDEPPCDTQGTDEKASPRGGNVCAALASPTREITSVHIFNRDDDYETPPDSTPELANGRENEVVGLFKGLVDSDDDDEDGLSSGGKSFFRPMETPSPCGKYKFIRPDRLSDSAASDDNHDITMDSTAFSMHFIALHDQKSLMVLTKVGKPKSPSPVPIDTFSGGRDSSDMSLVGESMHRYDYGKLCPKLEALLAGGSEFNAIPLILLFQNHQWFPYLMVMVTTAWNPHISVDNEISEVWLEQPCCALIQLLSLMMFAICYSFPKQSGSVLSKGSIKKVVCGIHSEKNELSSQWDIKLKNRTLPSASLATPGDPEKNIQTTVEKASSSENFVEEQRKVSSVYASLGPHTSKIERSPQKSSTRKRQTQNPNSKEPV
ncbi:hypothetical protein F3Y22_tig00117034pilonHSYRG00048 [Hibiscus syriacus]|uniref:Uncharacterized protein n=1 Tax=Hibiscus syriacus TaxID=106335 RepID=A0A6A2WA24_HIBSY|nr:hypothetical protein F3Y22_tig00117034pilonHSYRG00048 [Hibiscus syriacus]